MTDITDCIFLFRWCRHNLHNCRLVRLSVGSSRASLSWRGEGPLAENESLNNDGHSRMQPLTFRATHNTRPLKSSDPTSSTQFLLLMYVHFGSLICKQFYMSLPVTMANQWTDETVPPQAWSSGQPGTMISERALFPANNSESVPLSLSHAVSGDDVSLWYAICRRRTKRAL